MKKLYSTRSFYILLLFSITILTFVKTFFNDFQLGWDDQWQVLEYEFVTQHSFNDLLYHFTHYHGGQYFPVNTLVYILVYECFGFNPTAFHTACLFFHLINIMLVFQIIVEVLGHIKKQWSYRRQFIFAFLAALIFAIHPLQVESVAWISASKIVLYSFFFLLGILFYLRYYKTYHWSWLVGVVLCYLFSYGSKEQAIIFPFNLIAFDFILNRYKNILLNLKIIQERVVWEKIPFLITGILLAWFSLSNNLGTMPHEFYPVDQRILFGMSSFMDYVYRFIAPVKLFYFYFFPIEMGEELPTYYWVYLILVFIAILFIQHNWNKRNRIVVFGFMLFVINLILVLHIIPMPRKMITADRYMYFSAIGASIVIVWLLGYLVNKYQAYKKWIIAATACWLLFLSVHSFVRTNDWKDSDSVKKNVNELIEARKQQAENHEQNRNRLLNEK